MLKRERLLKIIDKVNAKGIVTVNEIIDALHVSDMTARRDLDELEKAGKLIRIHGGAQSITNTTKLEKSNSEKLAVQIKEKREIAVATKSYVNDGDTIFIGPGTTLEFFAEELLSRHLRIITNSLPVFNILKKSDTVDLILIGGEYRNITGAFVGRIASQVMTTLKFSKAFISCNGIFDNDIATYNESEGEIQQLAMDNAIEKYILADNQKFNTYDFSVFYHLDKINKVITDSKLPPSVQERYQTFTDIIIANKGI